MSESPGETVHLMSKGTIRIVDEAEKEASEVLHSLLSVERIEKPSNLQNIQHEVVVLSNNGETIEWHNTEIHHNGNVYTLDSDYGQQGNTVAWDNTLALDIETSTQTTDDYIVPESNNDQNIENPQLAKNRKLNKIKGNAKKALVQKRKRTVTKLHENDTVAEDNGEGDDVNAIRQRFRMGCECQDDSCFRGLNPDNVYKHRLNITELTKEEHDMYLMGLTMACMSDPGVTVKQRERQRLRAQYVYQGRRVCLSAFLYLENCTLYQLKRIRKHVMTHGVTPRVHGNHGKKPHNVFSLETYRRATDFLKGYVEQHNANTGNCKNTVLFPPEISRKTIHNLYQEYMKEIAPPEEKIMGYSTFRHFMKEQFPHVRFCKTEIGNLNNNSSSNQSLKHTTQTAGNHSGGNIHQGTNTDNPPAHTMVVQSPAAVPSPMQAVTIPVVIHDQNKAELAAQTAYIMTPVSQIMQSPFQVTVTPITNYAFTTL